MTWLSTFIVHVAQSCSSSGRTLLLLPPQCAPAGPFAPLWQCGSTAPSSTRSNYSIAMRVLMAKVRRKACRF
ncbi:hypothetical protein P280DRAFT_465817 [Massarina eburnea CBS 473.64]|uniref:Uncharacterized protein n=1 Tax=Massarina eburnea CBS 473.64 TaxID=1395130 RepID=A0A6A6SCP6_9PLEO|nr:hypothetical protein P280DRAFT_465817 [Massarina eburnea CBS 473.64]